MFVQSFCKVAVAVELSLHYLLEAAGVWNVLSMLVDERHVRVPCFLQNRDIRAEIMKRRIKMKQT